MSSEIELFRIYDVVDGTGQSTIMPEIDLPSAKNVDIAPWEEPPTPQAHTPKSRSFGFAHKASFNSFRPGSFASMGHRGRLGSDTQSTLSIPESLSSTNTDSPSEFGVQPSLRKSRSGVFNFMRPNRSKASLRPDGAEHPSLRPPPVPDNSAYAPFLPVARSPSPSLRPSPPQKAEQASKRIRKHSKRKEDTHPPTPPPKDEELHLDTNLSDLDGIVDPSLWRSENNAEPQVSPATSTFPATSASSQRSHSRHGSSDHSSMHSHSMGIPEFRDPFKVQPLTLKSFPPRMTSLKHQGYAPTERKISPKTVPPAPSPIPLSRPANVSEDANQPAWIAPESWAVQADTENLSEQEYSSGAEEATFATVTNDTMTVSTTARPSSSAASFSSRTPSLRNNDIDAALPPRMNPHQRSGSSKTKGSTASTVMQKSMSFPDRERVYTIRIYTSDNAYHVVSVGPNVTVGSLLPKLNQKLLHGEDREKHKLYLKDRARERVLHTNERPADIVKNRLMQAGYDLTDIASMLGGESLSFLLRFIYKSEVLGTTEKDIVFDNYEYVDLTSKGLRAIPVDLHKHADSVVSLYLSRNPMLEIPLDFIQDCTTLRELRLSHMAMRKVPNSVRHSHTLHRLDLSCNKISELDDAQLHLIPTLHHLFLQNNRLENLPLYFPRLRSLCTLNLSNNQFLSFPVVICQLETLKDVDISFNSITEIPEEISKMRCLERLIVVSNQIVVISPAFSRLTNLRQFDCRRNHIEDLTVVCSLPHLEKLSADHNALLTLEVLINPYMQSLDVSRNDLSKGKFTLIPHPPPNAPGYSLQYLELSHTSLTHFDDNIFTQLTSLRTLKFSHNNLKALPDSLGELRWLETLICSDNQIETLPGTIGLLQKLETLDAHNNRLRDLPDSLWECASLLKVNFTSNLLTMWKVPPSMRAGSVGDLSIRVERKGSASSQTGRQRPPLAYSLEKLYLGENKFSDDVLSPLLVLEGLRVLNLSFNHLQELSPSFFKYFPKLEELYLSGNELTALPGDHLARMTSLSVLFLNGNKLQTLPHELGKVKSLTVLDVGSNLLRYNINNWEYDWNWNFNKNLKYLNMSGNKRLQIKSDTREFFNKGDARQSLAGFTDLAHLRVLGLMDVTTAGIGVDIPDENDDRRVRTSTVSGMGYGIADTMGRNEHLNMLDLVHEFPGRPGEMVFGMFGRAHPPRALSNGSMSNRLAKHLHDRFVDVFLSHLTSLRYDEGVPDALRRAFLRLNHELHDNLYAVPVRKGSTASGAARPSAAEQTLQSRSGASGLILYIAGKKLYCANAGNILAVVSRSGKAHSLSTKHDPYDRDEMERIRLTEGWISPPGLVNDEIDLSRSFGFFHLFSLIARPAVQVWDLGELDEFVIMANRGLWDYVSHQTAVDIARGERDDPMIAAQKLRDFAMSYGADGSTMIMIISVGDLFKAAQPLPDPLQHINRRRRRADDTLDVAITRLGAEVPAPTGHITMVFTDIVNSTGLWELNPGMQSALAQHHKLLRRHLRLCGGYEVKTEGDAFVISFQTAVAAMWWCMTIQQELLKTEWPLELLECDDGKPVYDNNGILIARGMSIRMGVHCGEPICEMDPVTRRMDYYGPMVNRVARIEQSASGGQIQVSSDVLKELQEFKAIGTDGADLDHLTDPHLAEAVEAVRRIGIVVVPVGQVKLKGLETTLHLSTIYPEELAGRKEVRAKPANARVQFSIEQMRQLGTLCLRLEALATSRIFKSEEDTPKERDGRVRDSGILDGEQVGRQSKFLCGNPSLLLPEMRENMSGREMMLLLDSMAGRIENAVRSITLNVKGKQEAMKDSLGAALLTQGGLDMETLQKVLNVLRGI
ncbi:hypothetical protein CYLTODRAFT_493767 [Cylindrobasidium torrendii FP15055 ss-10]|uniref:Adenylate cyclase n=1 Tax=Cylindrobasidium torrendii FP15055 ss-10 TaxID=1314674 RepID=A0A0D7AZ15_9AGAR|nr:hypothetical protein CYLTODRAFT_493767 [Cylindrobasidium torrendii FP15055 ss-10]